MEFTTAELVEAARAGRSWAWQELVNRYGRLLRARTRAYGLQEADAADVIQATWLRLHENLPRLRDPDRLGGWLGTTAARECLRVIEQRRRYVEAVETDGPSDPASGPEQRALAAETAREVRAAVAELPPRNRSVIAALFAAERPSYAQIASGAGIPIGSIGPTRHRILRQLRDRLEPQR